MYISFYFAVNVVVGLCVCVCVYVLVSASVRARDSTSGLMPSRFLVASSFFFFFLLLCVHVCDGSQRCSCTRYTEEGKKKWDERERTR